MAVIRGGAATPTRYYKKKKKPVRSQGLPSGSRNPAAPTLTTHAPKGTSGPGHVNSIAPFKKIAAKSQAGKSLTIKDLQYMQRLAWTSKAEGTPGDKDPQLRQAITIARRWIEGLKAKGGIDTKTAQGEKVNIGAGGLEYHSFHETGVAEPTKKYQGVLDSYAKNGGNDILSSGPLPTAVDQTTPATAPPAPQASDIPVPPADGPVRDIALGQWQATGTIPGPQKMVDLLSAGLSMTDLDPRSTNLGVPGADAWMAFMQTAHKFPSKVPPPTDEPIPVGGSAADLMFKQADFSKAPASDESDHGYWGSKWGGVWETIKHIPEDFVSDTVAAAKTMWSGEDEYLGKKPEVYQGARDLDWFMGLEEAQKKEVQKVLAERGFTPAESGAIPTVSFVLPYVSQVNQFVYSANLAPAMFSKDPHEKGDAAKVLARTNVQGGGTELGQLAQTLNGSDDEAFLTTIYNASFMARPVGISESGFALWYAKKWGTDKLPQTEQAGAQAAGQSDAVKSFFENLGEPAEVAWHYAATSGKLGDFVTKVLAAPGPPVAKVVGQMDKDLNDAFVIGPIKTTLEGGVSASFKKANEVVALTFAEANRILCAANISMILQDSPSWKPGEPLPEPEAYKRMRLGDQAYNNQLKDNPPDEAIDRVNGYASVLENVAKGWKMSPGRKIFYDYLSGMGVDPADHEFVAFGGQMATEGLMCLPLQAGAAAIVGTALRSTPALAALKALQVKSHAEILTAAMSPSRIMQLYNVTPKAAKELAGIKNVDEMLLKLNGPDRFGAKFFDPDMNFTARSVAQNLRVKMTGNTKLAPAYRAFMSPLPEGIIDTVTDTEHQVLGALRYAGIDSKAAHDFVDGMIDTRLGAADFPEMAVRSYLTHPKTGFNALIEKHFRSQSVSEEFFKGTSVSAPGAMLKESGLMSNVGSALRSARAPLKAVPGKGASTKLDELHSFLRRFRGKKAEVGPSATRVGYSLRPDPTVAGRLLEGSLGLPTDLTNPVLTKVLAARKVIDDIDKRLPDADAKTAASLGAKRVQAETSKQIAIHELNVMEPQVVGMPTAATEAQFARTFSPDYTPTELAIFSGGKSMQEWAILQKTLHLTDINSAMKRMWLSRMGTMITIIGSDEMLRGILNGVNPLGGIKGLKKLPGFEGTMSADAAEAALRSPSTTVDILGITDIRRANDWGEIGPDAADITARNKGVHQSLKTFNYETSMPVKDWLDAFDAAYADLIADAERAKFSVVVKPPKVGDVVPGVGVDAQIADLTREAEILVEGAPEARGTLNIEQPVTDADLRGYIRAKGGISRDNAFWDSGVSARENRTMFGHLDTPKGGMPLDDLAALIADDAPGFGIYDSGDLWGWLQKQGAKKATTTTTETNARLYEIDAKIARLRATGRKATPPKASVSLSSLDEPKVAPTPVNTPASEYMYLVHFADESDVPGILKDGLLVSRGRDTLKTARGDVLGTVHGWDADAPNFMKWELDRKAVLYRVKRSTLEPDRHYRNSQTGELMGAYLGDDVPASDIVGAYDSPTLARDAVSRGSALSERDQIALHKTKASAMADAELGRMMREDGSPLNNLLRQRNSNAFDPELLAAGLDNEPWIKDIGDEWTRRIHAMMSHGVTTEHLRTGKIGPNDLKSATVQNIYGPVQYAIERIPIGTPSLALPLKISDTILGTLGHMATHLKKQEFGNFFEERMATLKGIDMPRLEKLEVSRKYAVAKTDELSYLNGRTLVEENLRNVIMFLPAYRQFLTWWAKRFATHPFGTHMLMKGISSIPPVSIPDSVKGIGGVDWSSGPMNFFAGLSGEGNKSWLPPVAPTITIPAEGAALTGNPDAVAFFKLLNGGFEPGGPQMRWLDSLVYGALGKTPYDMAKALGIPAPGSEQIDTSRKKRAVAEMVAQGVKGGPDAINAGAAVRAVRAQEAGKGGLQWALPGTWSGSKAKFTVSIPPQDGLPGYKMDIDMGRIATAQWMYLSAISDDGRKRVIAEYPEYATVANAWELYGEKQLEYLSKNRWVIGLVSPRNESPPEGTIVTPLTPPGKPLSMEDVAKKMKERYDQVDKYVLAKEYQKQEKIWDKGYAAKYKARKGQAKSAVEDPKMAYMDWYYKPRQAAFYEKHKEEINRLLKDGNEPVGLSEQTTVVKLAGEKHLFSNPYLFPDMLGPPEEDQLTDKEYEGMKRLEGSGLLWGKELVQGSRRYGQYVEKRKKEITDIQNRFLRAALAPYKSSVHPDDWALFDKSWSERGRDPKVLGNKLLGFLTEIDKRSAALKKLTFATKEYKAEYYKLKDFINTVRTKNPVLAPYIGATAPKLLSTGQLALNKPAFVDVKPSTMKEWEKMRNTLFGTPGLVKATNVLKLKRSASPELRANWDEAVRALSWDFTLRLAAQGRDALTKTNNPYGWYKGWTIESKFGTTMQGWMKQNMHAFTNSKAPISKSFSRQWGEADKAAGGNLIYDLLDTSK